MHIVVLPGNVIIITHNNRFRIPSMQRNKNNIRHIQTEENIVIVKERREKRREGKRYGSTGEYFIILKHAF